MERVGIRVTSALGVSIWELRRVATRIGTDHDLALALWDTGIHECRLLAGMIADPTQATEGLVERWAADIDSWDLCDQTCGNFFARVPDPAERALRWSARPEEFVKRAGFALVAELAWYHKSMPDEAFEPFLAAIEREAEDDRRYVKQAVNWALRNIGKRNLALNARSVDVAMRLRASASRPARWIGADALRELTSTKIAERLSRVADQRRG